MQLESTMSMGTIHSLSPCLSVDASSTRLPKIVTTAERFTCFRYKRKVIRIRLGNKLWWVFLDGKQQQWGHRLGREIGSPSRSDTSGIFNSTFLLKICPRRDLRKHKWNRCCPPMISHLKVITIEDNDTWSWDNADHVSNNGEYHKLRCFLAGKLGNQR